MNSFFHKWINNCKIFGIKKISILILIFFSLFSTVFEIGGLSIFLPIFQYIANQSLITENNTELSSRIINIFNIIGLKPSLGLLLIFAFSFLCLRQLMNYFFTLYSAKIQFNVAKTIRDMLFKGHLLSKSGYQEGQPIGIISNVLLKESTGAVNALMLPIQMIANIIAMLGTISFLFLLSPVLTLSAIPIFIIASRLPYIWIKKTKAVAKKSVNISNKLSEFLITRLKSPKIIKISGTENKEYVSFSNLTKNQFSLVYMLKKLKALTSIMTEPVFIGIALVIIYVSFTFLALNIEVIGLFIFTLNRLGPIQKGLILMWQTMNEQIASIELVTNTLSDLKNEKESDQGKKVLTEIKEKISLNNISFSYDSNKLVLKNIDLEFKIKSINILLGPSGAGKTTLVDIFPKMILPDKGKIFIDNNDYLTFNNRSLRKLISFVPQNPQILSGTIRNHICYGVNNVSEKKLIEAAKLASAHEFINNLNYGYDTVIGDNAYDLSGGQRQRLDLARALLKESKILIMDEPTSNLDRENIGLFNKTITKIKRLKDIIIILITHQIIDDIDYDQLIVMNNGRIEAAGDLSFVKRNSNWYNHLETKY